MGGKKPSDMGGKKPSIYPPHPCDMGGKYSAFFPFTPHMGGKKGSLDSDALFDTPVSGLLSMENTSILKP